MSVNWNEQLAIENDMPERIQLKRTKGWRMPPNTVKVDRSTRWGNKFRAEDWADAAKSIDPYLYDRKTWAREMAAEEFAAWVRDEATAEWKAQVVHELGGKNLACWCPLGTYCHGDVLLALANTRI